MELEGGLKDVGNFEAYEEWVINMCTHNEDVKKVNAGRMEELMRVHPQSVREDVENHLRRVWLNFARITANVLRARRNLASARREKEKRRKGGQKSSRRLRHLRESSSERSEEEESVDDDEEEEVDPPQSPPRTRNTPRRVSTRRQRTSTAAPLPEIAVRVSPPLYPPTSSPSPSQRYKRRRIVDESDEDVQGQRPLANQAGQESEEEKAQSSGKLRSLTITQGGAVLKFDFCD